MLQPVTGGRSDGHVDHGFLDLSTHDSAAQDVIDDSRNVSFEFEAQESRQSGVTEAIGRGQVPTDVVALSIGTGTVALADTSEALFFNVSRLAVSIEASPAKAGDKPSGDFILSGHCVKLW